MCHPAAWAAAAITGGMYLQDRSLRKSIKAADTYKSSESNRQLNYENTGREQLDTAREGFEKSTVDQDLAVNTQKLRDAFINATQQPAAGVDILNPGSNNQVVLESKRDQLQALADDNMAKANLQASLDAFGQTLVDKNPLLARSAQASNLASNFARGSLGALNSEMAYAQTKANNPLAQLLQVGGQIALGNYLAGPAGGTVGATGSTTGGTYNVPNPTPMPRPNYNPYTGS